MLLKIVTIHKPQEKIGKIFDISKVQAGNIKKGFIAEFYSQLSTNQVSSIEQKCSSVKNAFLTASANVLGFRLVEKKHWMSESTWDLIEQRRSAKRTRDKPKTIVFKNLAEREFNEFNKAVKISCKMEKRKIYDDLDSAAE